MTFLSIETSLDSGSPVFLYQIFRSGVGWRYTNVDRNVVYETYTYNALPILNSGIVQEGGAESDEFSLTMPASAPFCQYLDAVNTTYPINILVLKVHPDNIATGDVLAATSGTASLLWAGELITINRPAQNQRELTFATSASGLRRAGLRLTWARACPHTLYGRGCLVDKSAYATTLTSPVVVDGITLSSAAADALADGWFNGGFIQWSYQSGVLENVGIESHVGAVLTLQGSTQGMAQAIAANAGPFIAYPGCNRTPAQCNTRFNNSLNYGGIEYLQGESPFSGKPLF